MFKLNDCIMKDKSFDKQLDELQSIRHVVDKNLFYFFMFDVQYSYLLFHFLENFEL